MIDGEYTSVAQTNQSLSGPGTALIPSVIDSSAKLVSPAGTDIPPSKQGAAGIAVRTAGSPIPAPADAPKP